MTVKRRRLPNFEACSVALFASLAFASTAAPARAQASAPMARIAAPSGATAPTRLLLPGPLRYSAARKAQR